MFVRKLRIEYVGESGAPQSCPLAWIDNFAMRNFTNDAIFDDTLPVADGLLEAGHRVPLDRLQPAMENGGISLRAIALVLQMPDGCDCSEPGFGANAAARGVHVQRRGRQKRKKRGIRSGP